MELNQLVFKMFIANLAIVETVIGELTRQLNMNKVCSKM